MNFDTKNFITKKLNIDFQLTPLTGDASTRQYFKIKNGTNNEYILCAYKKNELTSFDYFLDVNSLFKTHKIKVPNILHTSKSLGLMILKNLGNVTLESDFKNSLNLKSYCKALNELVKIQNIPSQTKSIAHSYAFTIEKFNWEFNFSLEHLTNLYSLNLQSLDLEKLNKEFNTISKHLFSLPQVVTHRDYHSRNLLYKNDEIYVIDFQDARMGNSFYDLTSLIEDTYTNLSKSEKKELLSYYIEKSSLIFDKNFNLNYNTQALQRSIKACGSFARLKNLLDTDRYLKYLKPSFTNINHYLKELNDHPELSKLIHLCLEKEDLK